MARKSKSSDGLPSKAEYERRQRQAKAYQQGTFLSDDARTHLDNALAEHGYKPGTHLHEVAAGDLGRVKSALSAAQAHEKVADAYNKRFPYASPASYPSAEEMRKKLSPSDLAAGRADENITEAMRAVQSEMARDAAFKKKQGDLFQAPAKPSGGEKLVKVNTAAVANDVHSKPQGWGSQSGWHHTRERAEEALGPDKTARLVTDGAGNRRIESHDGRWSVNDPAPGSYREMSKAEEAAFYGKHGMTPADAMKRQPADAKESTPRRARAEKAKADPVLAERLADPRYIPGVGMKQESYWMYKAPPTPTVADLPPGAFKGDQKGFESLSPGMRREIERTARQAQDAARKTVEQRVDEAYQAHKAAAIDKTKGPRERTDAIINTREALQNAKGYRDHGLKTGDWNEALRMSDAKVFEGTVEQSVGKWKALDGSRGLVERTYHIDAINDKTGRTVRMSATPMTHDKALIMRSKMTPYKEVRYALVEHAADMIEGKPNPGWSDQARTRSLEVRKDKAGSNSRSAGGKVEKVTRAKADAAPKYEVVDKQTGKVVGKAGSLKRALDSVNKRDRDYGGSRFMHRKVDASPQPTDDRTSARPATAGSMNQNHSKGTQNPNNLKAIVEGKKGRAKAITKTEMRAAAKKVNPYTSGAAGTLGRDLKALTDRELAALSKFNHVDPKGKTTAELRKALGAKVYHDFRENSLLTEPTSGSPSDVAAKRYGRASAALKAADPHTPAPVKAPSSLSSLKGVQIDAMLHDMNLATSGTRAAKESRISKAMEGSEINKGTVDFYAGDHAAAKKTMAEVKAARAAPAAKSPAGWSKSMGATAEPHAINTKPPHRAGAGAKKALGLLAPVAIGAAMLSAANEAKAEGRSQTAAAAKEGAVGAGGMAVFMGGTAAATAGLVKAGMTAARAVPVVQGALMAGGALKGAWDARKGGAGAMAAGAAKGAWDMSLPGMVVNTGIAAKEAVSGRMAVTAAPSAAPASFQAASERFHAMRAAAATSDAGEKKKGWSNAARIGAYKARMAKSGSSADNLPYGGALTPPKPLK